jgi:hypothetical protein
LRGVLAAGLLLIGFFLEFSAIAETSSPSTDRTRTQVNQEVIRTYLSIYLEQRDYVRAEEALSGYLFLSKENQEGDLWFQLGQLQSLLGRYAEACHSFQMASSQLTQKKFRIHAAYEYASCLNRMGRQQDSIAVLKRIAAEEAPETNAPSQVLELIEEGYILKREEFPPYSEKVRGLWRLSGALGSGYDSNVLLLAESVAADTPASGRGGFFVSPSVQAGRVGRIFGDRYDSRWLLQSTTFLNSDVNSFNSLYSRADFVVGSGPVRWGVFADIFFLNRDPFQLYGSTAGLSWTARTRLTHDSMTVLEVPLQYQTFPLDQGVNRRNGWDVKAKWKKLWWGSWYETLSLQMIGDAQWSDGRNYRLLGVSLPAWMAVRIPGFRFLGLLNTFSAETAGQYFAQSDVGRRDVFLRLGTGLARNFGPDWVFSAEYSAIKNLSTLASARYSKEMVVVQLSWQMK